MTFANLAEQGFQISVEPALREAHEPEKADALIRPLPFPGPVAQMAFVGTSVDDRFAGGAADDTFDMVQGGDDIVKGKGGNDTFNFGAALTRADQIDGGIDGGGVDFAARDRLLVSGDYSAGVT